MIEVVKEIGRYKCGSPYTNAIFTEYGKGLGHVYRWNYYGFLVAGLSIPCYLFFLLWKLVTKPRGRNARLADQS